METWPMKAMELASQAPYIGTPNFKKNYAMLKMARGKADNAVEIMDVFINGDWQFVNEKINIAMSKMSQLERDDFLVDTK